MLKRTNEKNILISNLNFTLKNFSKSFLIDSRNSRFLAVAADRFGGKRASEKIP
jgi:hypothetical protein